MVIETDLRLFNFGAGPCDKLHFRRPYFVAETFKSVSNRVVEVFSIKKANKFLIASFELRQRSRARDHTR